MKRTQPYASGYSRPLVENLVGHVHADGALSLERGDGAAVDLPAEAVDALVDLLRMSGALRAAAARRGARATYRARWGEGEAL